MMIFNVLKHNVNSKEDEWLNDIKANTLEELEEAIKKLQREYQVEIEVEITTRTIYVGYQCWMDL